MNLVIMKGRLTADATVRTANSGKAVAGFTLAVDRKYKNKDGERQSDFIRMTAFGNTAEFIQRYTKKGQEILIEGEMQQNDWEKDGVKHQSYQVVVNQVHFCGSKSDNQQQSAPHFDTVPQSGQQNGLPNGLSVDDFEEIISDGETPF